MQSTVRVLVEVIFLALGAILNTLLLQFIHQPILLRLTPTTQRRSVFVPNARTGRLNALSERLNRVQLLAGLKTFILSGWTANSIVTAAGSWALVRAIMNHKWISFEVIWLNLPLH